MAMPMPVPMAMPTHMSMKDRVNSKGKGMLDLKLQQEVGLSPHYAQV